MLVAVRCRPFNQRELAMGIRARSDIFGAVQRFHPPSVGPRCVWLTCLHFVLALFLGFFPASRRPHVSR